MKTRQQILDDAMALLEEIEQIFVDAASWNQNARKPDDPLIDPDPDGRLRRIADNISHLLVTDPGRGPLAEIDTR